MRTFSEFEKNAMRIIARQTMPSQTFGTLLENLFYGIDVDFDINVVGKVVSVNFSTDKDIEKIFEITEQLISIMVLFQYLESLYLLRLHKTYGESLLSNSSTARNAHKKEYSILQNISDNKINKYFCEHWNDFIFVTYELREFVLKDNFKSKQQLQHEEVIDKQQTQHKEMIVEQQKQHKNVVDKQEIQHKTMIKEQQTQHETVINKQQTQHNEIIENANKQVRFAKCTLIVAVVALVASILLGFITRNPRETTFNHEQKQPLIENLIKK